jgi:hypothetical protein
MPIPTYTSGYPPDGASLGQTKATIRNNLDGTFQTLGIDHVNNNGQPGSQPAGYHTVIHEVSQASVSTVSSYNQVFAGVPGTLIVNGVTTPTIPSGGDTQLYSLSAMGKLSQLTGASAMTNGFVWSGGILFQWGQVVTTLGPGTTGTVTFPVAFPNNCFAVQTTPGFASGNPPTNNNPCTIAYSTPISSKTAFSWECFTVSNKYTNFYWFAIGN